MAIEEIARSDDDLVATVGEMRVLPGASNVIPGEATFTLDLRSGSNRKRKAALDAIRTRMREIAERRYMAVDLSVDSETPATKCDPALIEAIDAACGAVQGECLHLVSGAGHDAIAMSALCPIGMVFVRCKGGISHNPAESILEEDADAGYRALAGAVRNLLDRQ